jgi:L-ascorbate metabolism protein UlaG (beta-lactamase superfamily)
MASGRPPGAAGVVRRLHLGLLLTLTACSGVNPYFEPAIAHRGADGFHNNYPVAREGGFWRWQWDRWRDGLPRPPANGYRFPMADPEVAYLRANKTENTLTWIGHATVLLQVGGLNLLTDPHFGERASPVSFAGPKRRVPPGLTIEQLPHIDAVVISHNHYDHLDLDSIRRLAAQAGGPPQFYVPLGLRPWFNALGVTTVTELDWWDRREQAGVSIHFVPTQHWSQRGLTDRNQTLWGGWVIEHPALRFYFGGDTGYSRDFADVAKRFGSFDLAAIPIGAYEPRSFMAPFHVNPAEAVQIQFDLHARQAVGIHWGTFELTDEALDEPPLALQRELAKRGLDPSTFFVLRHGETRRLDPRPANR